MRIIALAHMVPPSSICSSSSFLPPPNKSQATPFARPQDLTWARHLSQLLPPAALVPELQLSRFCNPLPSPPSPAKAQ